MIYLLAQSSLEMSPATQQNMFIFGLRAVAFLICAGATAFALPPRSRSGRTKEDDPTGMVAIGAGILGAMFFQIVLMVLAVVIMFKCIPFITDMIVASVQKVEQKPHQGRPSNSRDMVVYDDSRRDRDLDFIRRRYGR